MEKYKIENGIGYKLVGDYYIPNLVLPNEPEYNIGKFGLMRKQYLKNHRKGLFSSLLTSGKLNEHLHEIDQTAIRRMDLLTKQMAKSEGVTEQLKSEDQMKWVGRMNNIRNRTEEIIREEIIYS